MAKRQEISRKLARVFLLQIVFISLAALLGVLAAKYVLGGILIQQALRDEAGYFWEHRRADPAFPLPNTHNMMAYLAGPDPTRTLPPELVKLGEGFHRLPKDESFSVVYVSGDGRSRLYLVFDGRRVEELALYFGMIPLTAGLIGIYIAALIGYRLSGRVFSPLLKLAREVDNIQWESPEQSLSVLERFPAGDDDEVRALSGALARLSSRILSFIERERTFTRDVSHELRSPITVVRMAADMLLSDADFPDSGRTNLLRIKRAAKDMEELTDAFLLMSRESEQGLASQRVCVNELVEDEIDRASNLLGNKPVEISLNWENRLWLNVSERVLSILIGNLIRNAFAYTDAGHVRFTLSGKRLLIEDSGMGIGQDQVSQVFKPYFRGTYQSGGHGVGLTIVKRLSDRFGWPVSVTSQSGAGTTATVEFPQAEVEQQETACLV